VRLLTVILLGLAVEAAVYGSDTPKLPSPTFCASTAPGGSACKVPKQDLKTAKKSFEKGLKLRQSRHLEQALEQFEAASRLIPQDAEFATARELTRQQLVYEHVQIGNAALAAGKQIEAIAEFREALHLDPDNQFAQQQLGGVAQASLPTRSEPARVVAESGQVRLAPQQNRADFHFRGDSRELLTQIAQAFGVTPVFDDSVVSRRVRFDVQNVDFDAAMRAASQVTKTFWTAMDERQLLIAADTPQNHRQFDRLAARTFYLPGTSTPQQLNDVVNALRSVFGITFISQRPASGTITVRAPQRILDAATSFLDNLDTSRPQVIMDFRLYQVSRTLIRNMGLQIPNQFQMFNIPAAALVGIGGQNIQDLVNQLISSGGINQATSTSLSALLAQLQNQNQNSIFSKPLATFGNGTTLFGVSLGQAGATFALNQSEVKDLQHATLRAGHGTSATFRVGSRYPILNATFSPIFNSAAISQVIANQSFIPAFPSFNYEDLGLTVKIKPQIHSGGDVSMDLELSVRSLGATSFNGVPIINNREYKGSIRLADGEPAVVAGSITRTDTFSMSGIPGFGTFPGLNRIMTSNSQQHDEDELLLVVTPHIVASPGGSESTVWMSGAQ
jgi:general secretion pathway protein D